VKAPEYRTWKFYCLGCGGYGYEARVPKDMDETKAGPVECARGSCQSRRWRAELVEKTKCA
jgi:hypothetical protein